MASSSKTNLSWEKAKEFMIASMETTTPGNSNVDALRGFTRIVGADNDHEIRSVPQVTGWYLIHSPTAQSTTTTAPLLPPPVPGPVMSHRSWQPVKKRPGWRFRVLNGTKKNVKGREVGFGPNPEWTAAVVVVQPAKSSSSLSQQENNDDSEMQVDPPPPSSSSTTGSSGGSDEEGDDDNDSLSWVVDGSFWPPTVGGPMGAWCAIEEEAGGAAAPISQSLLFKYSQAQVGVVTTSGEKLCLLNAAKWKQDFPQLVDGVSVDVAQLQVVHIKVLQELINEVVTLKQEVKQLREGGGRQ